MSFPFWNDQKSRAKKKLKLLQMLTHSGVVRPAGVEMRYSNSLTNGPSAGLFENRIPYGLYISGKGPTRKKAV
jgi:hypothetical protein